MDLPTLIRRQLARPGTTLRTMEDRASEARKPISRSMISDYMNGKVGQAPTVARMEALAAAIDCTLSEVAAAVAQTFGFDVTGSEERRRSQRAEAWLRLTSKRTDKEVAELLLVVEQVLRMRDLDRPNGLPNNGDASRSE